MVAITDMVSLEQRGDIALVLIDNPPVNALSHGVRLGLLKAFEQVADDDAVKGVVLACRGRTFIAGADITEFGKPPKAPGLAEPQAAMEDCPKPVVAAIHGTALGGGLEVAMCAHYRVGAPAAQYGQPEVKLGLVPGAGGTQRLPRVTGVAKALEMCAIGDPIGSQEALAAGLIDAIIEGDLVDGAVAFAEQLVADGAPLNKIRDRDEKIAEARLPTVYGEFTAVSYQSTVDRDEHLALVKGNVNSGDPVVVRVHSECLTGDVFGSTRCDCGEQAARALQTIQDEGRGVFLYMRQEGRGIGIHNKLRAYSLQDDGMDTVDANIHLGFAPDLRHYGVGAQILSELGVRKLRLLTNNPKKVIGLESFGLKLVERMPLVVPPNPDNARYLESKRARMGHLLDRPDNVVDIGE